MELLNLEDQTFEKLEFSLSTYPKGQYENCSFIACDFSNANLSNYIFIDCVFTTCNLSLAKLSKTTLRNVHFIECKLTGLHFEDCYPFGMTLCFDGCNLTHSSFFKTSIKETVFKKCLLLETDFAASDLTACVFELCDLSGALFDNTILEKADLRTSFHFSINPASNRIKKAKFSLSGLAGLLENYDLEIDTSL
jgi:uncharacterized protein YjbI with pentapeptide repeats